MTTQYDSTPVIGYGDGLITSDRAPVQIRNNLKFFIDGRVYDVHPFRKDLGGYPVRWHESEAFFSETEKS